MQIAIFGTGYVGLVLAATMSDVGHDVTCVDVDVEKIAGLKRGEVPIYEPGLEALVRDNQAAGRLTFTTDPAVGVASAPIIFIAVGTPPEEDGSADLRHVLSVGEMVGTLMQEPKIIINKSTVPVGTADRVKAAVKGRLAERGLTGLEFDVVSNPEFLKEGAAVADCMKPDRIILGVETAGGRSEQLLRELYGPFNRNHDKILVMDVRSAELTKYAANCMLAAKISFMNEMAHLADKIGADIEKVRLGIGSGSSDRLSLHLSRCRLWWILLSKGCAGPDQHGARARHRSHGDGGGQQPQQSPEDPAVRQDPCPFRKRSERGGHLPSGACPSNPTPTISAKRRPAR
jgi:UDPglucose 6-dehydrogenase